MDVQERVKVGATNFVQGVADHKRRFAFVVLIDVSGSTSRLPDPDIHRINNAVNELIKLLKDPPKDSTVYANRDAIDLSIIAYNEQVMDILDWTEVKDLPDHVEEMRGKGGTHMGDALEYAVDKCIRINEGYASRSITNGMPHIIHLTDGIPTDLLPIDGPAWNAIRAKLSRFDGRTKDLKRANILHFCAPKAYSVKAENGKSGAELLALLTGKNTVLAIGKDMPPFEQLAQFVTVFMDSLIAGGNDDVPESVEDAKRQLPFDETESDPDDELEVG
ncbi:VWA domain-containing protein [Hyphomicrobium sp. GJ21]|uniref:vWA domain-containing protein n=1 Tax=Hyphomicrobium sp. GJ21 TaxID=113574 RepID=UPI000A5495F7|nr:VWA domain-containing protein [Hyphomicrobium sp. GJ21]